MAQFLSLEKNAVVYNINNIKYKDIMYKNSLWEDIAVKNV